MPLDAKRAQAIFADAIELADVSERVALLDRECGGHVELRQRVELLLAAHDDSAGLPAADPHGTGAYVPSTKPTELTTGTLFAGRYKIREKLGEGGMGTVYVSDQTEPVQRRIALKIIKTDLASDRLFARFEQERQALALMDHPNIAKVLDAGVADSAPYFAMELIKGVPITKYCDEAKLCPKQRLELFIPVCHAVQHAHQKGIIHRDLKPSNILVGLYDGRPVPKVIDFGVAKATGAKLTDQSVYTEVGSLIGTLEYMSPEQAELNNLDIDTRSDIYALGVVLYELLTGTVPHSRKELKSAGFAEMLRIIKEVEPPKPSTRLSGSGSLPSIAATRHTEPKRLTALLRNDLDWIVMKALEKDRSRRYDTANGFAMDIQRYLADEPVLAGPPSARYRLRKFVRRNKAQVVAGLLVFLALVSGIAGTSFGLVRAENRRQEAEKARAAERDRAEGEQQAKQDAIAERDAKAKALVAETKARAAEKRARDQALAALRAMTDEVIKKQLARGAALTDEDRAFLRRIITYFEGFTADDAVEGRAIRGESYHRVGLMRYQLGELKEAEAAFAAALAVRRQLAAEFPDRPEFRQDLAQTHGNLGMMYRTGRPAEAEAAYSAALALLQQLVAEFPARPEFRADLANTQGNLAVVYRAAGRPKDAELANAAAIAVLRQLAAEFPDRIEFRQSLARNYNNLGVLLNASGRRSDAEAAYAAALAIRKRLPADFPDRPEFRLDLGLSYNNMGILLSETGRPKDAVTAYADSIAILKPLAAEYPARPEYRQELARTHNNFANLLYNTGQPKEAEAAYTDAIALWKQLATDFRTRPEFRRELARSQFNLANLFFAAGRAAEAQDTHVAALDLRKRLVAEFPTQPDARNDLACSFENLALVRLKQRDYRGAKAYLEDALPHHAAALKANPRDPNFRGAYRGNLGEWVLVWAGLGDSAAALQAAQKLRDLNADSPDDAYDAACDLALCILIAQKNDTATKEERERQAAFYADEALAILRTAVARGFKNSAHMKKDPDLDALRDQEDFKKLITELEKQNPSKGKP